MAGAPQLGVNFAFDPFQEQPRSRRRVEEERAPRMDGFSEDGLSYSVANDFPKIAAQALANYEAAMNAERQRNLSIDSRGIVSAPPVDYEVGNRLFQGHIAPVQSLYMGGQSQQGFRSTNPVVRETAEGIYERNPQTGAWELAVETKAKPAPSFTPRQKSDLKRRVGIHF